MENINNFVEFDYFLGFDDELSLELFDMYLEDIKNICEFDELCRTYADDVINDI